MTTYQTLQERARTAGSADEKMRLERQLLQAVATAGDKEGIKLPGKGQSESLESLLKEISAGIKEFKGAMKKIATLNNNKGKVTFELISGK